MAALADGDLDRLPVPALRANRFLYAAEAAQFLQLGRGGFSSRSVLSLVPGIREDPPLGTFSPMGGRGGAAHHGSRGPTLHSPQYDDNYLLDIDERMGSVLIRSKFTFTLYCHILLILWLKPSSPVLHLSAMERAAFRYQCFPGGASGKEPACRDKRPWFNPWVRKIPWRRKLQSTPVFLLGESHGQRSLAGYSP